MKIISIIILLSVLALASCASNNSQTSQSANKVGYQELSRTLQPGQRIQVETITGEVMRFEVLEFSGDMILAKNIEKNVVVEVDINTLTRIRLLK